MRKALKRERREALERLTGMPRFASIVLLLLLVTSALTASDFTGQVGRIDEALLGLDWYRLRQGEFPIIPLVGVKVSVLDCDEDCPDPVLSDPAGYFQFADLASPARLRFEPPECAADDPECEPLQPREVERQSGARTALGAKWPDLVVDVMQRFMPSVADAIYVKREGEVPNRPGASGSASYDVVWVTGRHGWETFQEFTTFVHELTHVFELRLRLACWQDNRDVEGYVLQESWLQAYDADRDRLERLGMSLREPEGYNLTGYRRGLETLAWFADFYLRPDHMVLEWRKDHSSPQFMTHAELEEYAPNRIDWFERMLYGRNIERRSYLQAHPEATTWPGMCEPPERMAWALDRLPPLPKFSKQALDDHKVPAGFKCGALDLLDLY
ncbi:MAG: hypothetical protein OXL36_08935 [Bryobacterales bacterium]|nr:hypothetical protein [Bryobacterales bacterium]